MNGKVSKMLNKMNADDKKSKRSWKSLNVNERSAVMRVYRKDGPGKALVEFSKQLGMIK